MALFVTIAVSPHIQHLDKPHCKIWVLKSRSVGESCLKISNDLCLFIYLFHVQKQLFWNLL
jgi:hypothetical protein